MKQVQTQLLAAQNEGATAQTEIERLRVVSGRLEQSVAQANEAAARAAASTQAFDAWKKNIRGQLMAADYRWSDDSAFVRIPKSVLPQLSELSSAEPFSPPGVVAPYARELMGLTPAERQSVEATLQRHFAELERATEAGNYETNNPSSHNPWAGVGGRLLATNIFSFAALPEELVKQRADQMLAEIRGILGEERWPLVRARLQEARGGRILSVNLSSILKLDLKKTAEQLKVYVGTDGKGMLKWSSEWGRVHLDTVLNLTARLRASLGCGGRLRGP